MTTILVNSPATMRKYLEEHVPTGHDIAVHALIVQTIDRSYNGTLRNRGGDKIATVGYVLEKCIAPDATRSGSTTDEVGRDAEYYFKSRYLVAKRKDLLSRVIVAVGFDSMNAGYYALKSIFWALGIQDLLKTDQNPISRPGGVFWGLRGSDDGFSDNPDALQRPAYPKLPRRGRPARIEIA